MALSAQKLVWILLPTQTHHVILFELMQTLTEEQNSFIVHDHYIACSLGIGSAVTLFPDLILFVLGFLFHSLFLSKTLLLSFERLYVC